MYYVYIIKNKENKFYIGFSSDLKRRFLEHNNNQVKATKYKGPWILIYYEAYVKKMNAMKRELRLKHHGKGWQELKKRII